MRNATIHELLKSLNKKERIVMLMHHIEGQSMKETGRHLELSESRISQIHSEVVARLFQKFESWGEFEESPLFPMVDPLPKEKKMRIR